MALQDIPAKSSGMRNVLRQATITAKGHVPILLRGEGGVGKNSLGRAIHNASSRAGWACQGRVSEMAQQLGIGRTTLWRKLKR